MKFLKRLLIWVSTILMIGLVLYLLRFQILKGVGNILVSEDTVQTVDAVFVLSGNAFERAKAAADIYHQGLSQKIITTGEGVGSSLEALGIIMVDAEVTQEALRQLEVDSTAIELIPRGTSTYEESEHILGFARARDFKRIMIISSKFHTRRIRNVFHKKFADAEIQVFIKGAEPLNYTIEKWWESEQGMIFVNNEYMKLLYYWLKY